MSTSPPPNFAPASWEVAKSASLLLEHFYDFEGPFLSLENIGKKDHFLSIFWKLSNLSYTRRSPHSFTFTNETKNSRTSGSQVKFAEKNRLSDWWWEFFLGKINGPYKEITNMAKSGKFSFSKFFQDPLWTQTVTCLAINSQTRSQKGYSGAKY